MVGLAHHLQVGGVVTLGLGDVPGPQAVAGAEGGVEAGGQSGALHHGGHALAGKSSRAEAAMAVNGAKHRPGSESRPGHPRPGGGHRAGGGSGAVDQDLAPAPGLLVDLGAAQEDGHALGAVLEVSM